MTAPSPYRVTVVCTGNICRSPMAEFLLRQRFDEAGLGEEVAIDSAGTHSYEVGNPADPRTLAVLARNGHTDWGGAEHVARKFERAWLDDVDLVLVADSGHLSELLPLCRTAGHRAKLRMFRSFDPEAERAGTLDMDDPWYGDDSSFEQTYAEILAAADGVVEFVRGELKTRHAQEAE
ncbi:low molecular weight protein-tyrosine-phosphatase [Pedococcus sp. 5OH_020]|uniref:low molecular weight protein-tyrosine-phosphatase n=1 Tax=Pedococcus sp. 5OH_020 TaxID=2989814 RepID=UPI0022E9F98E|nr:low molecular weight protein-tyrosine-phosphatase [Pedococcus sp. 5OH_020]